MKMLERWWKEMKEEEQMMNGEDKDEERNDSEVEETWKEWGGQVWLWDDVDKDGVVKTH